LHRGKDQRPVIGNGPEAAERGTTVTYESADADRIATARLMRPSAVTHTTDVEQRSIELGLKKGDGKVSVTVPDDPTLVPPGWYMLF
ncbi:DUF1929 domain-containing protein, partial [Streptomyces sp. SID7499]|nr:DUF1929 domain-containing protein [Streptomyces sp. SID7499]